MLGRKSAVVYGLDGCLQPIRIGVKVLFFRWSMARLGIFDYFNLTDYIE